MKHCELCKGLARMYCESDNASLCYDCDAKVHSANFLAARHSRSLLCQVCQAPTAWSAAGAKLGMSVSVCERCVDGYYDRDEVNHESESVNDNNEEIDEHDIQIVPPPPPSSSSSHDSLKPMRAYDDDDLHSDDDSGRLLSKRKLRVSPSVKAVHGSDAAAALVDSSRSRRKRKRGKIQRTEADRVTMAGPVMEFLKRNKGKRMSSIDELCRLRDDSRTVDLESSETSQPSD